MAVKRRGYLGIGSISALDPVLGATGPELGESPRGECPMSPSRTGPRVSAGTWAACLPLFGAGPCADGAPPAQSDLATPGASSAPEGEPLTSTSMTPGLDTHRRERSYPDGAGCHGCCDSGRRPATMAPGSMSRRRGDRQMSGQGVNAGDTPADDDETSSERAPLDPRQHARDSMAPR